MADLDAVTGAFSFTGRFIARRLLAAKYEDWREGRRLSAWARESLPVRVDLEASGRAP